MLELMMIYWPYCLAALSFIFGLTAAVHVAMTKKEVRTAIGWVGVLILSPILGSIIYSMIGVNRIRRKTVTLHRRKASHFGQFHMRTYDVPVKFVRKKFGRYGVFMKKLGDKVNPCYQKSGNEIHILRGGDQAYNAILSAIEKAERSIFLETYIFDHDEIGKKIVKALADAVKRRVVVRVLIDAVGARYSFPSIVHVLKKHGVQVGIFNGNIIIGLRLPYANLRTHRKIIIIDGKYAFTGGMNIRAGCSVSLSGMRAFHDVHFCVKGPVLQDLFHVALEDWAFASGETLNADLWSIPSPLLPSGKGMFVRVVSSGPDDRNMGINHRMLLGAFSTAERSILIKTPYLLPDRELVSALVTAARRGVRVNIVVPDKNNLRLVDRAMHAQFDQLVRDNCRIWRSYGPFDHSKLISIDNYWVYIGTSNVDPRSLRLNFEIDLEVMDRKFAKAIAYDIRCSIENAREIKLGDLEKRPFFSRLLDHIVWLGSPYL
ncbi:MAG: cardiolipin synthase [Candidatus Tokpelaia sp. JSC161]|jgi:cardiolipin synthase|nr:MAG: cardiolipin synthase [Candidatus Tokpelaia sp. JSC161]